MTTRKLSLIGQFPWVSPIFGCTTPLFRAIRTLAIAAVVTLTFAVWDASGAPPTATRPHEMPPVGTPTKVVVICGHPGDEPHHKLFAETIDRMAAGLVASLGVSPSAIEVHFGAEALPGDSALIRNATSHATADELTARAGQLVALLQPEDMVWIVLIGHAHHDGRTVFFNLPGPDMSFPQIAQLFAGLRPVQQTIFITTPVSGYALKPFAKPGRVVISATEADFEINETEYPHALADVLAAPPDRVAFDADGDGVATLFDFYVACTRRVVARYEERMAVVTEHALIDDQGDGRGAELQSDYLTVEQGGRAVAGVVPRPFTKAGRFAQSQRLEIVLPEPVPETPADALAVDNAT